jgi:inner membrane protein
VDPLSQAALGAAVAHGCCHRRLGWRAAVWGAVAGAVPDVDILLGIGGDAFDGLASHRGVTHSLFFAPVVGPLWGFWLAQRERRAGTAADAARRRAWMLAVTLALLSHPLLDYFTPYGTQLLAPLSDARFAWPAMPIVDPAYTLILLAGLAFAWRVATRPWAGRVSAVAVLLSCAYIGWAAWLNDAARDFARTELAARGVDDVRVSAYPTLLQIHYRRIVARSSDVDRVGYVSMWSPCAIAWGSAPRIRDARIDAVLASREGRIFEWFTMDMVHGWIEHADASARVRLADLRYGVDTNPRGSLFAMESGVDAGGAPHGSRMLDFPIGDGQSRLAGLIDAAYGACRG